MQLFLRISKVQQACVTKLTTLLLWLFVIFNSSAQSKEQAITYSKHIAPILSVNCAPCHKPDGAAPFSLLTYEDAEKHAQTIGQVTKSRYMPPWKADPHYTAFANERRLTDEQIQLIQTWVSSGAVQGKPGVAKRLRAATLPTQPQAQLPATADLVLRPKNAYQVKGNSEEHFVLYKIPFELSTGQPIRSIEFVPGHHRLLHHANFAIQEVGPEVDINTGSDYVVSDQFLSNMQEFKPLMSNLTYYGGWIPGSSAQVFPAGVGFTMPKRGVILLTVHYGPSLVDTSDWSSIKVYFANTPVTRQLQTTSIGSAGIGTITPPLIIPADSVKSFTATITTRTDLSILYVWPHMHLLGKQFQAWAQTPDGREIPLVRIPEWDFRWQEAYKFKQMVHLPQGTKITVRGVYDNTTSNPSNPFSPPRRIVSQDLMESRSEMLNLILLFLPYQPGDEKIAL